MGNCVILTRADREILKDNNISPDKLVVSHRSETTTCYLNHCTRDNILLGPAGGNKKIAYEPVRPKKKTKAILRRNGIDPKAVDVTMEGTQAITMVHKGTQTSIYLARGDRRW